MVNIRELRREQKLSLTDLGNAVGVSRQAISSIERGKTKPNVETAKKLGGVLGFDWWKVFE